MQFNNLLDRMAASADTRHNIITDGLFTCTYAELPALSKPIERFLEDQGIAPETCLAVECINSLAVALLLLTLLRKGYSFLLSPPVANNNDLKPTPHFCRHRLKVVPATRVDAAPFSPARLLQAEANGRYNGRTAERARLYLRTSGSMGASKIVVHAHEKLIGNARNCAHKYGFTPGSRVVIPVPIAHMYGFGAGFLAAIVTGASIDLQEKTNLLKYLEREKKFQPTIAFATPPICDMLLKGFKTARSTYEVFITSAQRIREELFRAFDPCVGGRLVNQYGSTEMGAVAACVPGDSLHDRATTIGRPMAGVQLRVDSVGGEADGSVSAGELFCNHPNGFEGYINESGEWLQHAASDGWYRTGDLATVQTDGRIIVSGRADASVNRSGYLVLLSDIERLMEKLDTVGEVVVVAGKGDGRDGHRLAAFCVPRPGNPLSGAQLRQRCFDVLPRYAIPDEVRVIETLPMLPSGKVDRQTLAALVE